MRFIFAIIVLLFVASGCGNSDAEKGLFESGRTLVLAGDYGEAQAKLNQYLFLHPNGKFASRANFFLAKSYFGLRDLAGAEAAFRDTIENYAQSLEARKSIYKLATIALLRDDEQTALKHLSQVIKQRDNPLLPEAEAMHRHLSRRVVEQEKSK